MILASSMPNDDGTHKGGPAGLQPKGETGLIPAIATDHPVLE